MNGLIVSVVINIFSSIIYDVVGKGINLESKKLKQIKENAKQSVSRGLARMQEQSRIFKKYETNRTNLSVCLSG